MYNYDHYYVNISKLEHINYKVEIAHTRTRVITRFGHSPLIKLRH